MSLLAAAGASGSPVRKVVLKSSGLVYGAARTDPYYFREDMARTSAPRTNVERSLLEVEAFLRDFADDSPHVNVTLLRFANVLGDDLDTPFAIALRRPVVPEILGFDPRVQFVHSDDVVGALMYATNNDVPGVYNVAGDGNMPWSEVCATIGKPRVPLSPWFTNLSSEPLRMLRLWDLPPEALQMLRYGRTLDNVRFQQAGFTLPLHERRDGRFVRAWAAPREDDRRQAPGLPLRARGGGLLPSLARRDPARLSASFDVQHLRLDRRDRVAVVTLVDRERRNAMTAAMVAEIVATFDELEADDGIGAVVLTGEPPAFCSGADVAALGSLSEQRHDGERRQVSSIYEGFLRVLRSSLPTIAAVNGPAVGAGLNLALACHLRLAGASARFDTRFLRIGLHPGGGHAWMLERAVGPQAAAAMLLFGQRDRRSARGRGRAGLGLSPRRRAARRRGALAARAAEVPKELAALTIATLREAPWQPDFEAAVATEVGRQAHSLGMGWFRT